MNKVATFVLVVVSFVPNLALAHCPLCTAGAGMLAAAAASLGVSSIIVGILIGAFGLALSLWLAGLVKKTYIQHQKTILTTLIFLATIVPIMPLVQAYGPFYVSLFGEYGTLLHNTYTVNLYVFGSVIGALIVLAAPYISRFVTKIRGKQLSFQGLTITFFLLVAVSVIVQILS